MQHPGLAGLISLAVDLLARSTWSPGRTRDAPRCFEPQAFDDEPFGSGKLVRRPRSDDHTDDSRPGAELRSYLSAAPAIGTRAHESLRAIG